ncbi:sigma-54-dependent Fis family transcriptional regulator [Pedobacter psychrodurus]|uniref:Sigma-54-dependent Fis family transcriptional regulator n=1 Tax=Pedobacter psychrodurus TaxID=2530456 RepID=A0A4V2MRR6_9SPHI|nr:sigma-54 dependent transcriptional regulator [Pedobacter psychrodurus]TCD26585.1 sigma-54-dependent Fis family transcriptional regulator [Pedobacter psychrodurus]
MKKRILIVEDEFVEANNLEMILHRAGYYVCDIAGYVTKALEIIEREKPDLVLLDIFLKGKLTGIDLAKVLKEKNIAFVYLSANSNKDILAEAKKTEPYGFLVKPFREKDVLVTIDIANYLHEQKLKLKFRSEHVAKDAFVQHRDFEGIIGKSQALNTVFNHIKLVAPTDTSVLILGESGTGKERLVDSLHAQSLRKSRPLIKVNCAALPASLIESELFGHEKGAFTGAYDRRIGKFEQADTGTIFLDEVGELPLDLQVKLLRVLQEKEIERVGGKNTIKVDIRIVAATNRNLETEVANGKFRMDLFYRLNVFPIAVPPLRTRKDDIPVLVAHFISHYAPKLGKDIERISDEAMKTLMNYNWPGNIRELEHLIERSILLSPGKIITSVLLPIFEDVPPVKEITSVGIKTMEQNEVEHIVHVLKICKGKIAGPGGAAELLNLPYSTLVSRMKKLGIKKENVLR